jgi:hypothetical protein
MLYYLEKLSYAGFRELALFGVGFILSGAKLSQIVIRQLSLIIYYFILPCIIVYEVLKVISIPHLQSLLNVAAIDICIAISSVQINIIWGGLLDSLDTQN